MEPVIFSSALVTRNDGMIVIALFNGDPPATQTLIAGDEDAVRSLADALNETLSSTPNDGTN
jgi:hypothetical protein